MKILMISTIDYNQFVLIPSVEYWGVDPVARIYKQYSGE
jgi:hypothetical protein